MIFLHIVFIVGSYYPNYSAVGKCAGNVAEELSKYHKITVICSKNHLNQNEEEIYNSQRIIRIMTKEKKTRFKLEDNIQNTIGFKRRVNEFRYKLYKVSRILKTIISKTSIKKELVQSYLEALNNINEPVDAIIPVSMPFESVVAAVQYKTTYNKKVRVIPYLFDQFVDNENLHRFKFNKDLKKKGHIELENNAIKKADAILILKQLKNYYLEQHKNHMEKVYVVEHPLLRKPNTSSDSFQNKMLFIYAGSFYKTIRNPEYMLNLFNNALDNLDGTLSLYSFGNCNEIINKYTSKNKRIINYGKVPTEKVYEELYKNNFLVAVGNNDNKQVPSKIFEYLSYGKPIIYFYSNSQDINLDVLKKYNLAFCIDQRNSCIESNLSELIRFCKDNVNEQLIFEEVAEIFKDATPEYTVDIIESIIMG